MCYTDMEGERFNIVDLPLEILVKFPEDYPSFIAFTSTCRAIYSVRKVKSLARRLLAVWKRSPGYQMAIDRSIWRQLVRRKKASILAELQERVDMFLTMIKNNNLLVVEGSLIHKELTKLGFTSHLSAQSIRQYQSVGLIPALTKQLYMWYGSMEPGHLVSLEYGENPTPIYSMADANFSPCCDRDAEGNIIPGLQVFGLHDSILTMTQEEIREALAEVRDPGCRLVINRPHTLLIFRTANIYRDGLPLASLCG